MKVEMVMPQMGESITEGTIVRWVKKVGDQVARDENILEISTDKVDSEIPSPSAGRIVELKAKEGETVPVGKVVAILETEEGAAPSSAAQPVPAPASAAPAPPDAPSPQPAAPAPAPPRPFAPAPSPSVPAPAGRAAAPPTVVPVAASEGIPRQVGDRFFSPLVRSMARAEGVSVEELMRIPGSGRGGRVTREDLGAYLKSRPTGVAPAAAAAAQSSAGGPGSFPGALTPAGLPSMSGIAFSTGAPSPDGGETVEPYPKYTPAEVRTTPDGSIEVVQMDNMRQKIAEHMVRSKATSPHVASVTEADMTRIVRLRDAYKDAFQARHGFKLTYTPIIVAATVRALLDYPMVNSSVEGSQILVKRFVHIGVAVALESGLIVPVVKHAEEKSFLGLARAIHDLAARARAKKLVPDDVQGATFSMTNMGGFGNLFGIPIINQPNVGILGAGAIVKRPVVVEEGAIAVRDIMYLSLSYDHRVIDGALGGRFIQRVRHYLEKTDLIGAV